MWNAWPIAGLYMWPILGDDTCDVSWQIKMFFTLRMTIILGSLESLLRKRIFSMSHFLCYFNILAISKEQYSFKNKLRYLFFSTTLMGLPLQLVLRTKLHACGISDQTSKLHCISHLTRLLGLHLVGSLSLADSFSVAVMTTLFIFGTQWKINIMVSFIYISNKTTSSLDAEQELLQPGLLFR